MEAVLQESAQTCRTADPRLAKVSAALFTGAMVELAEHWLAGNLGENLDIVVEYAAELSFSSLLATIP
jgi:hypothetical protein